MSFYVTLPSHANRHEFPNNQANAFKIRLPQSLQLTGGGWQVGLSAISLPDARVNLYELVMKGQHVLGIKWYLKAPSQSGGIYNKYGAAVTKNDDIKDWDWVVDGVRFMKAAITHVEQKRRESVIQGATFLNDQGKHTYVKFRWEGDDLVIDNTNVCHDGSVRTPSFAVHTKLAVKMGWLRKIASGWILGPNLQQEFMGDQIPDMTKNGVLDHRSSGRLYGTEYELWVAFHQLECGVSCRGGGTHTIVARVLGHRRQHCGRQPRDRFVARNPVQARRTRHHVL